jgi:hypothetical protein
MRTRRTLLAALALALAAGGAHAQGEPGPGTQPLTSQTASKFFHAVCLSAAPGFAQAPATLAANGFAQSSGTGTYFHPDLNLSFQVAGGRCSMVFASDAAATEMALAFAAATAQATGQPASLELDAGTGHAEHPGPAGTRMMVEPFSAPSGEPYFRALLARPS